jgi:MoaA/NifB/PqqE/SkfB family radical SAM enzyme
VPTSYYVNVNYVCNERCTFCASDLTNRVRLDGRGAWVNLDEVRNWLGDSPPGPDDRVMLAGGEPTLHRELLPIVRLLSANCRDVVIFSNGVRLADPAFARQATEAGITRFEIALFGATAERHEAITRLRGSFERTLLALNTLDRLRRDCELHIDVRLLVSRQSSPENPSIVRMVHERAPGVDSFSLNRLILSDNAVDADATISWADAAPAINETVRLVRQFGYELEFAAMPLCVFNDDNAEFVRNEILHTPPRSDSRAWEMRYFDPLVASGTPPQKSSRRPLALPLECVQCDYLSACGRVESWYTERYGTAGLHSIHLV